MEEVICFQCGDFVSLRTAKKRNWYINQKTKRFGTHYTPEGNVLQVTDYSGTCPDCLEAQKTEEPLPLVYNEDCEI